MGFEVRAFVLTDIVGSTELWDREPSEMAAALDVHDALVAALVDEAGGELIRSKGEGDSTFSVFTNPVAAVEAARRLLSTMQRTTWATHKPIVVRVGIDIGPAQQRGTDWYGTTVNRTARLRALAPPGGVLVSGAVARGVRDAIGPDTGLAFLGRHPLRGLREPEDIWAVVTEGLDLDALSIGMANAMVAESHQRSTHKSGTWDRTVPAPLTPLFGRESDIDEVVGLFIDQDVRLVTLTGPGGTGKTRLSLAVAERMRAHVKDGVCFVDLAPLSDAAEVLPVIARALGISGPDDREPEALITGYLQHHTALLVLDNFEHLPSAWAVPVSLLTAVASLRVLVTSRAPLSVTGEQEYDVEPLAVPALSPLPPLDVLVAVPAVRLFLSRAQRVLRTFAVTEKNGRAVAEICERLDGLPLALELAAAHVRTQTPETILARLDDRLTLLSGGPRDQPDRHRSLKATIAWSYEMLSEDEQTVLGWLAVFAGDPLVEDVQGVADRLAGGAIAVSAALEGLARAALVRLDLDQFGDLRVQMLQTIREFAHDLLVTARQDDFAQRGHAAFYADVAREVAPRLFGPNQLESFERLYAERAELQRALVWAAAHDVELAMVFVGTLWHFWEITADVTQPRLVATRVIEHSSAGEPALDLLAPALSGLGTLCWLRGDFREAASRHGQARDAYEAIGDVAGAAWSWYCLSVQEALEAEYASAVEFALQALDLAEQARDRRTRSHVLNLLGVIAFYEGDVARAELLHEEALTLCRKMGDEWLAATPLTNLANMSVKQRDYERTARLLHEVLTIARSMHDKSFAIVAVETVGELLHRLGRPLDAARLFGACRAFRTEMTRSLDATEQRLQDEIIDEARVAAGAASFDDAWTQGSRLPIDEVIDDAIVFVGIDDDDL